MRTVDYDATDDTGNTETHIAVDNRLRMEDANAYEEGFAAASGVRNETAEFGGRVQHPETRDELGTNRPKNPINSENAGLADS